MPVISSNPSLYDGFALYGSGVTLVTVRDHDVDQFFIAASVLTASVEPFSLAVAVGQHRIGLPAIMRGVPWAVSVLAVEHLPLVERLTGPTTRDERLAALIAAGAETSPEGPLWLPDALVSLWCRFSSVTPVHHQSLIVGDVTRGSVHREGLPLMRWNRQFTTACDAPSEVALRAG